MLYYSQVNFAQCDLKLKANRCNQNVIAWKTG